MGADATPTMQNSLMYKLSYYNFEKKKNEQNPGYDVVRKKQIGVMFFGFLAVKFNIAHLPRGTSWPEFYVAAILTGIGFTMSLFVGSLAFAENNLTNSFVLDEVKIGVICGSCFSAIFATIVAFCLKKRLKKY